MGDDGCRGKGGDEGGGVAKPLYGRIAFCSGFSNYGEDLVGPNGSAGNKQYRHYRWSERIPGPLPDLNKGDPSFSRTALRHHLITAGVLAAMAIGWLAYKRATSSD